MQLRQCQQCYYQQAFFFSYCGQCGFAFSQQCHQCQQKVPAEFQFCGFCGVGLNGSPSIPPSVQPTVGYSANHAAQSPPLVDPQPSSLVTDLVPPKSNESSKLNLAPSTEKHDEPLPASAVARMSERRLVAILFCDVCGFTAMSEKLDPEEVSNIMHPLFELLSKAIAQYGGVVEKFIGDAIMALFGVPDSHEDDPERAVLAALEMQRIIQDYGAKTEREKGFPLNMRIGINVGHVVAGSADSGNRKDYSVMGDAINTAARMEQNATPGHILVTEEVYQLTQDSFDYQKGAAIQAKGKKEPLQSYELVQVKILRQRVRGFQQRKIPFVGRQNELNVLRQSLDVINGGHVFVAIEGDAGLGKSRLVSEVLHELDPSSYLLIEGASTSYSKMFSYFLLQNLLKNALHVTMSSSHSDIRQALQTAAQSIQLENQEMILKLMEYLLFPASDIPELKLLTPERLKQQTFKGVADFLVGLAQSRLLCLTIDDLHWCDAASLEWLVFFKQYLQDAGSDVRVWLSVTFRAVENSDFIRTICPWQTQVVMSSLERHEATRLLNAVLEVEKPPADLDSLYHTLLDRANGNPYYIEEVLKSLINEDLLLKEDDSWILTRPLKQLPLPNSIQRLIISRVDKLPERLRSLLQVASVINGPFMPQVLHQVFGLDKQVVETGLDELVALGYFWKSNENNESHYGYQQALTQEIIYNTLLKKRKTELHLLLGEHLENMFLTQEVSNILELLAHHYVRTPEHLKSIKYLYLSATKAARICANEQALEYYAQTYEKLQEVPAETLVSVDIHNEKWLTLATIRTQIAEARIDIYSLIGQYEDALQLCQTGIHESENIHFKARLYLKEGKIFEKRSDITSALELYEKGKALLVQYPISLEMAKLWNAIGWIQSRMGKYTEAIASCEQALAILSQIPDMQELAYANNVIGVVAYNQNECEKALEYYQKSLGIQEQIHDLWGMANSLNNMANVYSKTNRWSEAIAMVSRSLEIREKIGDLSGMATACNNLGHICQEMGNYDTAIMYLERSLGLQHKLKNQLGIAVVECNLGMANQKKQDWSEAIQHLNIGVSVMRALNIEEYLPEVVNSQIEIYLHMGNLPRVKLLLADIDPLMKQFGDPLQQAKYARFYGMYCFQTGEIGEAQNWLEKALHLCQSTGNQVECLFLYHQLYLFHEAQQTGKAAFWYKEFDAIRQMLGSRYDYLLGALAPVTQPQE